MPILLTNDIFVLLIKLNFLLKCPLNWLMEEKMNNGISAIPAESYWTAQTKIKSGIDHSFSFVKAKSIPRDVYYPLSAAQKEIFKTILTGKSATLLNRPPICETYEHNPMSSCIYSFTFPGVGTLYECGCWALARKRNLPGLTTLPNRLDYEKDVIEKCVAMALRQKGMAEPTLNIAILSSGFLFGEFSLLTRLIGILNKLGWSGKICLNLIDECYAIPKENLGSKNKIYISRYIKIFAFIILGVLAAAAGAHFLRKKQYVAAAVCGAGTVALSGVSGYLLMTNQQPKKSPKSLEQRVTVYNPKFPKDNRAAESLNTFLHALTLFMPGAIELQTCFFDSAEKYQRQCFKDKFKNNLLIGSDLDGGYNKIEALKSTTQKAHANTSFLFKVPGATPNTEMPVLNR